MELWERLLPADVSDAVVLIGLIVLIIGGWLLLRRRRRRKTTEFAVFAERFAGRYAESDETLRDRFGGPLFTSGYDRAYRHVLVGSYHGRALAAFEYSYTEETGHIWEAWDEEDNENQTWRRQFTVVALRAPFALPTVQLKRRGALNTLLGLRRVSDHRDEDTEFLDAFYLEADADVPVTELVQPWMRDFLLHDERARQYPLRFEGRDLLTWVRGPLRTDQVLELAGFLDDLLDQASARTR